MLRVVQDELLRVDVLQEPREWFALEVLQEIFFFIYFVELKSLKILCFRIEPA